MSVHVRFFFLTLACLAVAACASTHTAYVFGLPNLERTAWTLTYPDAGVRPGVMAILTNSDTGTSVLIMRDAKPGSTPSSAAGEVHARLRKRGLRVGRFIDVEADAASFRFDSAERDPRKAKGIIIAERRAGIDGVFILLAQWPANSDDRAEADMAWVTNALTVTATKVSDE